jgi:hypothetical protein
MWIYSVGAEGGSIDTVLLQVVDKSQLARELSNPTNMAMSDFVIDWA